MYDSHILTNSHEMIVMINGNNVSEIQSSFVILTNYVLQTFIESKSGRKIFLSEL